jgi:ectoine hydroxylase-related dioxygenase (phytanoyl-CoA dioxygenase family)
MTLRENPITSGMLDQYQERGILRLKLPDSAVELCREFIAEASAWLQATGNAVSVPFELATALPAIAKQDRLLVARLYKVARRFPSVKRLACDPWLAKVSSQLMGTRLTSCCHFVNVRIDLPGEEKYLLPPHQDFPYIQGSLNGVTWWIPYAATPFQVGPPSWIPGSHKLGVLNVDEFDYESTGSSGGRSFRIVESEQFKDADFVREPVAFGEALVFSTLLLHRSEPNTSESARINIQVRFDDALAQESYVRNYPEGLYLGDAFSKNYPEYVNNG